MKKYIIVKYTHDLKLFFTMADSLWIEKKTKAQGLTLKFLALCSCDKYIFIIFEDELVLLLVKYAK